MTSLGTTLLNKSEPDIKKFQTFSVHAKEFKNLERSLKSMMGITKFEWILEEEAAEIEDIGDLIDTSPAP